MIDYSVDFFEKYSFLVKILTIYLFSFLFQLTFADLSFSKENTAPSILLLNSYHEGFKGADDIVSGFRSEILKVFPGASIKTEYLDSKYYSGPEYEAILSQLLAYKYKKHHLDLIVASDDFAFNIVEKYYNNLFSPLPVVFCGTNSFNVKRLEGKDNFIGVDERPSFRESINLIFKLRPQTKRIVVIYDDSITGQLNSETFRSEAIEFLAKAEFEYLAGLPLETLVDIIQNLSSDSVAFYFASFVKNTSGKHFRSEEALEILANKSPVPIFGGWEFSLDHGIIGGKLINLVEQGSKAGLISIDIIKGKDINLIPRLHKSPNIYMFDDKLLKRFDIQDAILPRESVIINRPLTFYQENRAEVFIALSIFLAIVIICSFVALYKSKLLIKKAYLEQLEIEKKMIESQEQLRKALSEIKTLQGILPICLFCKKIRNDDGYYEQIEGYINRHTDVDFSHTICPVCMEKNYPDEYMSILNKKMM